jgi:uncharacterized membrane protein
MFDLTYNNFVIARVIHILAITFWIGGVAFVTTILIPSIRRIKSNEDRLALFESLEGKFAFQAKFTTLLTGLSGLYMLSFMDAWSQFLSVEFWWLHLMTMVWVIFTLVLFVLEPLFLHQWFRTKAIENSDKSFAALQLMHTILLSLSLLAIAGALGGSHGYII